MAIVLKIYFIPNSLIRIFFSVMHLKNNNNGDYKQIFLNTCISFFQGGKQSATIIDTVVSVIKSNVVFHLLSGNNHTLNDRLLGHSQSRHTFMLILWVTLAMSITTQFKSESTLTALLRDGKNGDR